MRCGMEVGLGPGDCVRWGPSSPVPKRGAEPPNFCPCPWWPNGWMYQDGTWHGGGPWYRPHCARRGPSSPSKKGSGVPCPIFGPFLLWTNGWMHQDATWYGDIGLGECTTPSALRRGRAVTYDVDAVDRGTETRSLRPPSAVLRRRRPRHAAHVVELLPLSLKLLKLPLSRELSSMLRLYARVVCFSSIFLGQPLSVSSC